MTGFNKRQIKVFLGYVYLSSFTGFFRQEKYIILTQDLKILADSLFPDKDCKKKSSCVNTSTRPTTSTTPNMVVTYSK